MAKPKVFLSAGHGGSDPGAVGNGLLEKVVNLNALLACREELIRHGVEVVCSRITDANDPVQEEVTEANASGADLAFSIHANAGGGDGFEALYYTTNEDAKRLAALCEKHVKALGQNSRGLKSGNHLYFVKRTNMTAVLVESFFLDNAKDKEIGDTYDEQRAFGVAYAKAILEYYDIKYVSKEAQTVVTPMEELTSANDITWELNNSYFPITKTENFVKELDKAKKQNSPLYWGYYKLVNKIK